jgi:hypothetical protein
MTLGKIERGKTPDTFFSSMTRHAQFFHRAIHGIQRFLILRPRSSAGFGLGRESRQKQQQRKEKAIPYN